MTDQGSNSSDRQESPPTTPTKHFNLIVGIGVLGEEEDVVRFSALWIADCERRAHRIVEKLSLPITLVPAQENDGV